MVKKVVNIVSKEQEEEQSLQYWQDKSAEERLGAVQKLREKWVVQFNKQQLYDESRKGLRRVYKVTKRF